MMRRLRLEGLVLLAALLYPAMSLGADDELPKMKFNDVREIAPGVFFRYSSISATDPKIPFGGSNHIWVVFEDYVLVFDANFPQGANEVIQEIRKTTDKPIRYVVDSHHHGDHAYGNAVFAKEGATIVAQANCARTLRTRGLEEFAQAGKGKGGRKDVADSYLKMPSLVFDDKLVLDDGKQRAELLFLGHAHTAGDAFLYLPKHKILCTGDACVNGAFNYLGHSDSASWVRVLERALQYDVKWICPGHGAIAGKDLLERQKRYFVDLRRYVQKGIDAGKDEADLIKNIEFPWYKEWTGTTPAVDNIKHVYAELTGRVMPWDLVEDFGIYEGPSPTKATPGWTRPKKIVVPSLMPARLDELRRVAPEILFVPVKVAEEAAREAADADAVLGFCTADIVRAGKNLRWIQVGHAGVEKDISPELTRSTIVLTNTQRLYGPNVSDQAMALLLCLSRGLSHGMHLDSKKLAASSDVFKHWNMLKAEAQPQELHGKNVLVIGLGGIGTQIGRRAHGFGMRIMAIDPNEAMQKPDFVFSLDRPAQMMQLLPKADVVVLACPLTEQTRGMFGASQFQAMKPTAYFINIARGGIVRTPDLVAALKKKQIAGAGLDVTDPEPLPFDHPLWTMPNVVISPHLGGQAPEARERQWRLWRENVRRFVVGEPLLCVVDKAKGY
jgi:phosphoglycerate dehydrogenase-like enzyme/glyoxylase-like metal-dependent hydrolase (beta-lactamase superfamily II)